MAKLTLLDLTSLESQTSAIQTLNFNFQQIEDALENTLSRDGTTPNTLSADLDTNDNRIINLGAPVNGTDAARLVDIAEALSVDQALIPAYTADRILSNDGSTLVWRQPSEIPGLGDLVAANNLDDLVSASAARTNLGLGSAAVESIGTSGDVVGLLSANKTDSGSNTYSGTQSFTNTVTLGGAVNHVLSATPTALTDNSIGFRSAALNTQDVTYTLALSDSGRTVIHTSASPHTWTIPPNSSVAYPTGTIIVFVNTGSGAVTVARGSGVTLRIAGSSTDADATLAQHGVSTLIKVGTNSWYISGAGVS